MIWSIIGDLTERPAQHDDYGHCGARKQSYFQLSKQLQSWGHQSKLPSLGQHHRLIVNFKAALDCSFGGRLILIRFPFPELWTPKLVPGTWMVETDWGKHCTSPTSTIFEIRTACRPEDSPATEDSTLATPNYHSEVSRASFRRTTTTSYALFKSTTTAAYTSGNMTVHGSYTETSQTLPATFTALSSIQIPLPVKKSRWVNRRSRTKLCTQQIAESIEQRLIVTRSRFSWNRGISSAWPRWKSCQLENLKLITIFNFWPPNEPTWKPTGLPRYRCRRLRNPLCWVR